MNRKSTNIISFAFALALCLVSGMAHAAQDYLQPLRIGLTRFSGTKPITVFVNNSISTLSIESSVIIVKRDDVSKPVGNSAAFISDNPTEFIALKTSTRSCRYRGKIEINIKAGGFQVINVVDIEDYLLGVVPAEMSRSNPAEALKAQAIAARTYALRNRGKHASSEFDLCDNTNCQCYGGVDSETPRCSKAVIDTMGTALMYNGEPASVMYSADCGGITENYAQLYSRGDCAYLSGVIEPVEINHRCWERTFALDALSIALIKAGVKEAAGLQSIGVTKITPSGRALEVEIVGAKGKGKIGGEKLRSILGLQSRLYTTEVSPNGGVIFKGKGWGHGIGMCQSGACALAKPPFDYTYDRILAHYFPGTTVCALVSGLASSARNVDVVALPSVGAPKPKPKPAKIDLDIHLEEPSL